MMRTMEATIACLGSSTTSHPLHQLFRCTVRKQSVVGLRAAARCRIRQLPSQREGPPKYGVRVEALTSEAHHLAPLSKFRGSFADLDEHRAQLLCVYILLPHSMHDASTAPSVSKVSGVKHQLFSTMPFEVHSARCGQHDEDLGAASESAPRVRLLRPCSAEELIIVCPRDLS